MQSKRALLRHHFYQQVPWISMWINSEQVVKPYTYPTFEALFTTKPIRILGSHRLFIFKRSLG